MFYCEYCRVAHDWPRSIGWPHMGVSRGKCEMCGEVQYCHDVPSSALPLAKMSEGLAYKECTECNQHRPHRGVDYVCIFCRGEVELPDPHRELREADAQVKVRIDDMLKHYLDKESPSR